MRKRFHILLTMKSGRRTGGIDSEMPGAPAGTFMDRCNVCLPGARRLTVMAVLVMSVFSRMVSFGAVTQAVDTILLEPETAWEDEVPVDLSWKTKQDNGRWIEEMGIAGDSKSLVLVINNLEENEEEKLLIQDENGALKQPKKKEPAGNSRLFYYSKDGENNWREVFATNCYVSGGSGEDGDVYGAYRLESAFGSKENPGSLVSYHQITSEDYWIVDPDEEGFGEIVTVNPGDYKTDAYINFEEKKAFSNYGMILKPEYEGDAYPALVVNCQQASTNDRTFCGVQIEEAYLRILLQCIDEDTRILISGTVEDLEGM